MLHHMKRRLPLGRISQSLSLRFMSTNTTENVTSNSGCESFAVSYLVQRFGLSSKSALIASKHLKFENPERPEKVVAFFNSHGFSDAQTAKIIKRWPKLLAANPNLLLSKLEFFSSEGFSSSEIVAIFYGYPDLLMRRLELIASAFMFIKDLVQSDKESIVRFFSRIYFANIANLEALVKPNLEFLRDYGFHEDGIKWLLTNRPAALFVQPDRFIKSFEQVKGMGFDPSRPTFGLALSVLRDLSKPTWDAKIDIYKRWGWSKEQTLSAFVRYPGTIRISEKKIMEMMDFFVNIIGLESLAIARNPSVLGLSVEKRLLPRYSVLNDLSSKGLIKSCRRFEPLMVSEEKFLQKYVWRYKNEAQHLLELYHRKHDIAE